MSIDIDRTDPDAEPRYRPVAWDQFRAEVLEAYAPPLKAPATFRGMKHALEQVTALAGPDGRPLVATTADLRPSMIAALIASRRPGLSPHSVRALLRYVRTACGIAEDAGHIKVNPFRRAGVARLVPAGRPQGRRHLSRDETRKLLDTLAGEAEAARGWQAFKRHRIHALVALIAYTGIRRNEALFLRIDDIDLPGRMIHIRSSPDRRLKTERSAQMVPLPEAVVPILETWLSTWRLAAPRGFRMPASVPWVFPSLRRHNAWHDGTAGDKPLSMLKAASERAGLGQGVNFQMLRRSLCTHLRMHFGASREQAARLLRHSPQVADHWYVEQDPDDLRGAVRDVQF